MGYVHHISIDESHILIKPALTCSLLHTYYQYIYLILGNYELIYDSVFLKRICTYHHSLEILAYKIAFTVIALLAFRTIFCHSLRLISEINIKTQINKSP